MIYSLGIDVSKDEFSAYLQRYLLSEQSHAMITRKGFANKGSGFKACMSWLGRHTKDQPAPVRITMEATGVYYEALALFIQQNHPHHTYTFPLCYLVSRRNLSARKDIAAKPIK